MPFENKLLIPALLFFSAMTSCVQNAPVTQPSSLQPAPPEYVQPVSESKPAEMKEVVVEPPKVQVRKPVVNKTVKPHEPSFAEVVREIFDAISPGKVIAFVEFTGSSGESTKFSQAIFQEVEPVMINEGIKKDLSFIERKDLKLLLDEWDLKAIFPSGGDGGAQMLLGADYIMTGKARLSKDNVQCTFKLVDLKDGRIVGTAIAALPAEPEFYSWENAKPPEKEIEIVSGPNKISSEDRKLSIWTDKRVYKIGEQIQIFFEVKEPLYVELIDVTPEGQITTIFPNPDQSDNYCMPGKIYSIPPENGSFELVVTPPIGFDRIKALASSSPFRGSVNLKTRGIQFTKNIVNTASTRANLSFEIR